MITAQELIAAGYRAYRHYEQATDNTVYTKVVPQGEKPAYTVNLQIWNFEEHFPSEGAKNSVSAEACFYLGELDQLVGKRGFTVALHLEDTATIDQVESFFAKMYERMQCVPDLHNR